MTLIIITKKQEEKKASFFIEFILQNTVIKNPNKQENQNLIKTQIKVSINFVCLFIKSFFPKVTDPNPTI